MSSTGSTHESTGINALSIDGGSIASLMSSLELVDELMRRIQRELNLPDPPLPRKYFRLMVGAGFAGLLVIMLGRLGMSVQEARGYCIAIMDEAFLERKRFGGEAFKRAKLVAAVERMLESCGASADARMADLRVDSSEVCKVMVCVAPGGGMRAGVSACMRTYATGVNSLPDCTIVEAVCSTFAVPRLFKPMDVLEPGGITSTYIGLSSFNPMVQLLDELAVVFRDGHISCVLSIGAKQKEPTATECERVAGDMSARFMNQPGLYFRLCVDQGMETISAIDWEKRLDGIGHARSYLRLSDNIAKMSEIAQAVLNGKKRLPVTQLNGALPQTSNAGPSTVKPCPPPSSLFTGRDAQLSRIQQCLGSSTQGQHVCILHGLGGAGKTQIALKFAEMHRNDYQHVFYADCTSRSTVDADFRHVALAKGVGDRADDALAWLARLEESWLIIYNNADDTSMNLRSYFPACSYGSILVTTRNHGMVNLARGVDASCHVSNMSEDEAQRLLAKAAGLTEDIGLVGVALIKALGCFPLAIVQAGAYIRTNLCSIQEYLDMYQKSQGQILEDYADELQKADDYELTVYSTWQVGDRQLSPLARQLYDYLAFMYHDQITEDIFRFAVLGLRDEPHPLPPTDEETRIERTTTGFLASFTSLVDGSWDRIAFLRAIKDLTSYSLVARDEANCSYSIHPLVQQWTRTVVADRGATCSCVAFLLALSAIQGEESKDYAYRRVLLNHVDCLPDSERLKPRLARRFQLVYKNSGRTNDQGRLVKAEHEANLRVLGRGSPCTLDSMGRLAKIYRRQGQLGEAEVLLQEVLESRKRLSGNGHLSTLKAMRQLASTYVDQGRWGEAEILLREVVEVGKRLQGSEHPNTLFTMGNLARAYWYQKRWEEAEVLLREVIEVRKRVSGNEHPDTLLNKGNLAIMYQSQGRSGEAEVLLREVVEVEKRVWGNEHPRTLVYMGSLAETYLSQGRWTDAEVLGQEVVEVWKRVRGSEHPDILIARSQSESGAIKIRVPFITYASWRRYVVIYSPGRR